MGFIKTLCSKALKKETDTWGLLDHRNHKGRKDPKDPKDLMATTVQQVQKALQVKKGLRDQQKCEAGLVYKVQKASVGRQA